jgi:hypothetical protein
MSLVKGENCVYEFYDGGQWKPYACSRSISFSSTTELIETTVTGAGKNKHFTPTVNSFTGSADGIVSLGNSGMLTLYNLRQYQLGHVLQRVRFTRAANDGVSFYIDTVDFYITNITDTASFDNIATFTMEMQGTGVIDQIIIEPPVIITKVKRYEFTVVGGEYGFTIPLLINKDIISVVRTGYDYCALVDAPASPASDEVAYDTLTGEFLWVIEFESIEKAYVLYQDI